MRLNHELRLFQNSGKGYKAPKWTNPWHKASSHLPNWSLKLSGNTMDCDKNLGHNLKLLYDHLDELTPADILGP